MTKDNGATWKNVTQKDLPPGGRVHTIEDSPHRKGSAYVSVYRMYLNDFKPYLYMTNDYGAHWTLLTDGANGIPANQPRHVVREDPEQEGLLYAGTLEGAYVSFDQGKHWQSLQQILPPTPVTDFKVHHGDLLASTMGRSFWIMDDVAPLRQIAASVMKTTRLRTSDNPGQQAGVPASGSGSVRPPPSREASADRRSLGEGGQSDERDIVRVSLQQAEAPLPPAVKPRVAAAPARAIIKPFEPNANVFLFTPAPAYRTHYAAMSGRPDRPEYPPVGARIDYYLAAASGEVKLDILDDPGKVIRSYTSESRGSGRQTGRGGGGRRGAALPSTLPIKVGMNRFVWDLPYPGD